MTLRSGVGTSTYGRTVHGRRKTGDSCKLKNSCKYCLPSTDQGSLGSFERSGYRDPTQSATMVANKQKLVEFQQTIFALHFSPLMTFSISHRCTARLNSGICIDNGDEKGCWLMKNLRLSLYTPAPVLVVPSHRAHHSKGVARITIDFSSLCMRSENSAIQ